MVWLAVVFVCSVVSVFTLSAAEPAIPPCDQLVLEELEGLNCGTMSQKADRKWQAHKNLVASVLFQEAQQLAQETRDFLETERIFFGEGVDFQLFGLWTVTGGVVAHLSASVKDERSRGEEKRSTGTIHYCLTSMLLAGAEKEGALSRLLEAFAIKNERLSSVRMNVLPTYVPLFKKLGFAQQGGMQQPEEMYCPPYHSPFCSLRSQRILLFSQVREKLDGFYVGYKALQDAFVAAVGEQEAYDRLVLVVGKTFSDLLREGDESAGAAKYQDATLALVESAAGTL